MVLLFGSVEDASDEMPEAEFLALSEPRLRSARVMR
jgi:hypothetical protein